MLKPAHVTCSFSITCGILLFSKMPLSSSQPEPGRLSKSGGSLCARRRRRSPPPGPRPSPDASRCPLSARSVTPAFSQERWGGDCHMIASCPSRFPEHGSADRLPGVSRTHASVSAWVPHCLPARCTALRPRPVTPAPRSHSAPAWCRRGSPFPLPPARPRPPPCRPWFLPPSRCLVKVTSGHPDLPAGASPAAPPPGISTSPSRFPSATSGLPGGRSAPCSAGVARPRPASSDAVSLSRVPCSRVRLGGHGHRRHPRLSSNFPWGNDTTKVTVPDDSLGFTTSALPPAADAPPVVPGPGGLVTQSLLAEGRASLSGVNGAEAFVLSDRICWLCF